MKPSFYEFYNNNTNNPNCKNPAIGLSKNDAILGKLPDPQPVVCAIFGLKIFDISTIPSSVLLQQLICYFLNSLILLTVTCNCAIFILLSVKNAKLCITYLNAPIDLVISPSVINSLKYKFSKNI